MRAPYLAGWNTHQAHDCQGFPSHYIMSREIGPSYCSIDVLGYGAIAQITMPDGQEVTSGLLGDHLDAEEWCLRNAI